MKIAAILVLIIFLLFATYFTVKSTVIAWLSRPKNIMEPGADLNLIRLSLSKLKDIGVINDNELEDIIKIYEDKNLNKEENLKYLDYFKVLEELKETGYFDEAVYQSKMLKLKNHYKAN